VNGSDGRWHWNPALESEIRKIVREELAALLASVADVAGYEGSGYETGELESSAMAAIEKVAGQVGRRIACPHQNLNGWGDKRCNDCGEKIPCDPGKE
jgi:hypothetical protein